MVAMVCLSMSADDGPAFLELGQHVFNQRDAWFDGMFAQHLEQLWRSGHLPGEVAHQHHGVRVEVRRVQPTYGLDEGFSRLQAADVDVVLVALSSKAIVHRVGDEVELGVPSPVERGPADARVGRNVAEGHARIAVLDEASARGENDRFIELQGRVDAHRAPNWSPQAGSSLPLGGACATSQSVLAPHRIEFRYRLLL